MKARIQFWFILWVVLFASVLYSLQQAQPQPYPITLVQHLQLLMVSSWVIPLPIAVISLLGMLRYKNQRFIAAVSPEVSFRVVTRGDNRAAVQHTILNLRQVLTSQRYLNNWRIEVVTDKNLRLDEQIIVPRRYRTANGAKWKARALQYALEVSKLPKQGYIFHLDEESQINDRTVAGIAEFIFKTPEAIGQGAILYNRELHSNRFLTMADSLRTGDDVSRFFSQYAKQNCIFGMHGSFILIRNDIEQAIGFDFPPQLCVTEDAYFGLKALQLGYQFGWVNGYVYEQSPRSVRDFLKQRRRWFLGIRQIVLSDLKWRTKGILAFSTMAWTGSVVIMFATLLNFLAPIAVPTWIRLGADISLGIYLALYAVGIALNLDDMEMRTHKRLGYLLATLVLVPVFSALEAAGVLYALVKPQLGFEVIQK